MLSFFLYLRRLTNSSMKKALALALLFFVAIVAQAQNHFDLGLSLGVGNMISKANHDTALAKQLFDDMESMTDFDLSLAYYFKTQNSLGLEAFFDRLLCQR